MLEELQLERNGRGFSATFAEFSTLPFVCRCPHYEGPDQVRGILDILETKIAHRLILGFEGTMVFNTDKTRTSSVSFIIDVASIDTTSSERDTALRGRDRIESKGDGHARYGLSGSSASGTIATRRPGRHGHAIPKARRVSRYARPFNGFAGSWKALTANSAGAPPVRA